MPAEAQTLYPHGEWQFASASAALSSGQIAQMGDGRAAAVGGLSPIASGDAYVTLTEGTMLCPKASGTLFAVGDEVWWDNTNNLCIRRTSGDSASFRLGVAKKAGISGLTVVEVEVNSLGNRETVVACIEAAGTALTNSTSETVLATANIPANMLKEGSIVEVFAQAIATATNGTDTFRYRVRIGGVAGSIIADSGAIDLANDDVLVVQARATVRTDGAGGTVVGAGHGVLKTTAFCTALASAAIDTTAATTVVLTCVQSVASASNSCRADNFHCTVRAA